MNRIRLLSGGQEKSADHDYDDGQIHDRRLVEIFNRYGIRARSSELWQVRHGCIPEGI